MPAPLDLHKTKTETAMADDGENAEDTLRRLILDLGSCRTDSIAARKRRDMIQKAQELLESDDGCRTTLAAMTGIRCTSSRAYRRVAKLFCMALKVSDQTKVNELAKGLCLLLRKSADVDLVEECIRLVSALDLDSTFSELAKESDVGVPAICFCKTPDWALFVRHTILRNVPDARDAASDMHLCRPILQLLSVPDWEAKLAPAVLTKVKSQPERILDTVDQLLRCANATALAQMSSSVRDEFISLFVGKHMKSAKDTVREAASSILQHMAVAAITTATVAIFDPRISLSSLPVDEGKSGEETDKTNQIALDGLCAILKALSDTKTLSQAQQRQSVYTTLGEIGKSVIAQKSTSALIPADIVSGVLTGIGTPLAKEIKAAVQIKEIGLSALLNWMVVAKKCKGTVAAYDKVALPYFRTPAIAKNGPDSLSTFTTMIEQLHPDLLESITLDLWCDAKFVKGLEGIVEASNKKHASSSSVAPVEGLVSVYLGLVHAYASSSSKVGSSIIDKALAAGDVPTSKTSFVYGRAMMEAIRSNRVVSQILPQIIAMYSKLRAKSPSTTKVKWTAKTAAIRALASCVTHPIAAPGIADQTATQAIETAVQTFLDYHSTCAGALITALFNHANQLSIDAETVTRGLNATRQARESITEITIKGRGSPNGYHDGMDPNAVRRVSNMLASKISNNDAATLANVLILMHVGSSQKAASKQRSSLIQSVTQVFQSLVAKSAKEESLLQSMADEIATYASSSQTPGESPTQISRAVYLGSISLLATLGGVASIGASAMLEDDYDAQTEEAQALEMAHTLCIDLIPNLLSARGKIVLGRIESMSEDDANLYRSPMGTLFQPEISTNGSKGEVQQKKKAGGKKNEDEEWEMEMRKELAKKKQQQTTAAAPLSEKDKKLVAEQDKKRLEFMLLLEQDYARLLASVDALALSDIEVGNACLPILGEVVLHIAVSKCPAMRAIPKLSSNSFQALNSLATCVYEIQEEYAPMIASALTICCQREKSSDSAAITVTPVPSRCEPAAVTIFEMDEFQDELSGASFAFLFPVVRAALMGPRTTPGCEGALRVLERHALLLAGETKDRSVAPLRKDMIISVLELLKHDRAQTFTDPNPYDTLVACLQTGGEGIEPSSGPALTTAELAALLDERGALGTNNCRLASMIALGAVALDHPKLAKSNPLIENRIWMNCFESNERIRAEARKTWGVIHGSQQLIDGDEKAELPPPSPMYAIPLLPLFNNSNESISAAAAEAYAQGMKAHTASIQRSIQKLCSTYIDSYPGESGSSEPAQSSVAAKIAAKAAPAPQPKKKATGVPASLRKKTVKKSALQVAGIGAPKKTTKKKSAATAALLKPKEERKLDQEALVNQFVTGGSKIPTEKDTPAKVSTRLGVLRAFAALTSAGVPMDMPTLMMLTSFLMAYGIADLNEEVKNASRNALRDVVASNGGSDEAIAFLLPHLDKTLRTGAADAGTLAPLATEKIPKTASASDRRKEAAVVALGSVALHLKGDENASKIDTTIDMLLQSLKTPSEDVQSSVADCLAKLMKKGNTQSRIEAILSSLMQDCLEGPSTPVRRGAAYGLSAAVKGSGIATLKKYSIVSRLEEACDSSSSGSKEGSLHAMELLCARLGLLFEPYVIVLLPSLLRSFSDSSDHVRKAASNTVGVIMSKLSAHGVKLVMPAVLTAFNDKSSGGWRTKQASIAMLGSMSHLAPKQLASALPKVVPKLSEAFSDTHPKVKASAQEALTEIATVVKNPEISSITPVLLKALTDPADSTVKALEALIETEFLHAIDAPSLALIVPILHRGLRDRGATTKRFGALIAGNMCTMINDQRDFHPYLPILLPDLKTILLDPIPDVRSIAAKALGSLTRGLGENSLPDLRPWLIERLRVEGGSSAERSGAAQGLTEVLIASGTSAVEEVMFNDILPLKSHPEASTREGVLWVLTFMPSALGHGFTPLLDDSLPALIGGLSDDNEQVRDVAMRAGRGIIKSHGRVHVEKILPILEGGMADDDHRIRVSSLMLLGDLLSMIGGTTVLKTDGDTQDDVRKAERAQAQLTLALGMSTRNRVLSGLYLARSDSTSSVRHVAIQVWKTIVSVTPRTLRQILPMLVKRVVTDLASGHPEKTEIAGKCLGDIVSKLGDSVLPEIIPVLRDALVDGDSHTRRGVCVGLSEVIRSSTKDQISRFLEIIVKVVQDALCDEDEDVRAMAAASFQHLHTLVGSRAMDEVVPALMVALETSSGDETKRTRALNGLTGILSIRSRELLPYIIPRLITVPISISHAKALSSIATVTGATIYSQFNTIIPALMNDLSTNADNDEDTERIAALRECASSIFAHTEETGVNWLVGEVASKCSSDKVEMRRECCWMFEAIVRERKEEQDFYEQVPIIIRELVYRFNDDSPPVLKAAHSAFKMLSSTVPAEELVKHVEFMRNLIASMVSDARRRKGGVGDGEFLLPAFNIPKGLEPLLPIYQRGILYGTPAIREASAAGLGEVISLTATKFLAGPLIIKMTGPLLRIVGDRNPSSVKIAILRTLGLILVKGGPALRAFVPQFQTTFVKALSDPSRQVRLEAIQALGLLMPLSTRVDPLLKELVAGSLGKNAAGVDSAGTAAIQTATLEALAVVLEKGGKKAKLPDSIPSALEASKQLLSHGDDSVREGAAKVMGAACNVLSTDVAFDAIRSEILSGDDTANIRHGKACAIRYLFSAAINWEDDQSIAESLRALAKSFLHDDKSSVKEAGCVAVGAAVGRAPNPTSALREVEPTLIAIMSNSQERMEVHEAVANGLSLALEVSEGVVTDRLSFIGIDLMNACLKLALSGAQRTQFAFNDMLYLALDVQNGQEGIDKYSSMAMFENAKQMKSLYSKVLVKIRR